MTSSIGYVEDRLASPNGQAPPPARQRNNRRLALGAGIVVASALAAMALYGGGERQAVLAVVRPVAAGAPITAADLAVVHLEVDPALRPLPARRRAAVVGRRAGVDLVAGTLLTAAHLAHGPAVGPTEAVVGLALEAERVPDGLRPGDRVLVVVAGEAAPLATPGRVAALSHASGDDGTAAVSVIVPLPSAPDVAAAGGDGRVSVAKVGPA